LGVRHLFSGSEGLGQDAGEAFRGVGRMAAQADQDFAIAARKGFAPDRGVL
jgi:hypothetical protein